MSVKTWIYKQIDLIERNIVKSEQEGNNDSLEFCKGQWNALNHLLQKIEQGHFTTL